MRLLEIRFDLGCRGLGLGQALLHLRRRGHAGRNLRVIKFGDGGADGGARARDILAPVANDIRGVEDKEEDRNEDEAPVIPQVQTMQAHETGAEPEQVGDEERRPPGNAAPELALDEIHGDERKDDESAPVKPMGQHKRKAGHQFPRNSPRPQRMADVSDFE